MSKTLPAIVFISASAIFAAILLYGATFTSASAPSGLPSRLAVATTTTVGPQYRTQLFASNPTCAARVVSTVANPIMLIFGDPVNGDLASTTVSALKGHVQAASTTVAYDSGLYGCGAVYAYGYAASTTITTSEFR